MKLVCVVVALLGLLVGIAAAAPPIPTNHQISSPSANVQNEEQVWVSPTDSNIVIAVWRDFRLGYRQIGIGRSTDGGNTWTDSLLSPSKQIFRFQSDPALAVSRDGLFYMCQLDFQVGSREDSSCITVLKSEDQGFSWQGPSVIEFDSGTGHYFEDKEFMTIDRTTSLNSGNVYVSWTRFKGWPPPGGIMFAVAAKNSMLFGDTIQLDPSGDFGQFSCPFVGSDGSVYVTWSSQKNGYDWELAIVKSTDGGVSFTPKQIIRPTCGSWISIEDGPVYDQPSPAADISGGLFDGRLYIAYASQDTTNHPLPDFNIEFIRSLDGGTTWSAPIYLNDDTTGTGARYDQFHPWMICNEEGVLVAVWYDQRTDPINHTKFDVFAAYSFDGGTTFSTNHRISEVSIDPAYYGAAMYVGSDLIRPGAQAASAASPMAGPIGEYIGVTAYHDKVNAVWTDTRNGNEDVYGANWRIPLLSPRLLTPGNNDTLAANSINLNWAAAWKAWDDAYLLEVAVDSNFTSPLVQTGLSNPEFVLDTAGLPRNTRLYWRVRAYKHALHSADSSDYSHTWSFCYGCLDADADGVLNSSDNCVYAFNPDQKDANHDGIGDACCCIGLTGNVDCDLANGVDISDLSALIDHLYVTFTPLCCPKEANTDGEGSTDISDLSALIDYLYVSFTPVKNCL